MAMSALSFLQPIPRLDPLCTSLTTDACSACSPISSLSGPFHSLWISSERSRVVVKAAKGRREKMDFFLDDVGESEDTIPDDVVDMEEWMRNRPAGFGIGKVSSEAPFLVPLRMQSTDMVLSSYHSGCAYILQLRGSEFRN